jgi:hypothetical protein
MITDFIVAAMPFSRVERTYVQVLNAIIRKENWHNKILDDSIWTKWKEETSAQVLPPPPTAQQLLQNPDLARQIRWQRPLCGEISEEVWENMKKELLWIGSRRRGPIEPSAVGGVWQADGVIPDEVVQDLLAGVNHLENVPDAEKDWHPGSNKQVLDLVHPSLFPLVYGQTRRLPFPREAIPSLKYMGGGDVQECWFQKKPEPNRAEFWMRNYLEDDYAMSVKYQWLPSEFDVSSDGKVRIVSYINNLHPIRHKGLYYTIERTFERFIPLFERVLDDLKDKYMAPRFTVPDMVYDEQLRYPNAFTDDFGNVTDEERAELFARIPPLKVHPWRDPEHWAPHYGNSLRGKRLQVIVKLANIELTPDNPSYPGGSWHVEGMQNEKIVATGIYYYESKNITQSLLSFRKSVRSPTYSEHSHDGREQGYIRWYYGIMNGNTLCEQLGSVETKAGRCIAFPNMFQHQVQPFELEDKSQPGVRKILVFFLVDPNSPILSTATIPPQQREWYADALCREVPEIYRLPRDIVNSMMDYVSGCPMSLEEAKRHREELMKERKFVVDETTKHIYEREFSLCEH